MSMVNPHDTPSEDLQHVPARPYSEQWYAALRHRLGATACRQLGIYAVPDDLLLSVVIPVYNERPTLQTLVERVCSVPVRKELILVDDCSSDGTRELLQSIQSPESRVQSPEQESPSPSFSGSGHWTLDSGLLADTSVTVIYHEKNRGKGAALRSGFQNARGDIVLVQDADLEYDPSEYPRLIQPIVEGKADVVYGSRFLGDQPHRVLYFWHYVGNRLLTTISNCFTNLNLTDMETCYKVFRREVLEAIAPVLRQDRFGFEPEVTAKIARRGFRVYEMSISYSGRTYEQGKKIGWRDGLQALWCIVRYACTD